MNKCGLAELGQGDNCPFSGLLHKIVKRKNLQFNGFQFLICGCLHLRYSGVGSFLHPHVTACNRYDFMAWRAQSNVEPSS